MYKIIDSGRVKWISAILIVIVASAVRVRFEIAKVIYPMHLDVVVYNL